MRLFFARQARSATMQGGGFCGEVRGARSLSTRTISQHDIIMKKFATILAMSLIAAGVASAAPANTVSR